MRMILYIDETECDDYFIVAGLLTQSKRDTDLAYKHFKKGLKSMKISLKEKQRVFYEFKAILLDRHYQRIKVKMLMEINHLKNTILFSTYTKKNSVFNQQDKEKTYISLLEKIVSSIHQDIDIIFDDFKNQKFEEKIIEEISKYDHVLSIQAKESFDEAGLQFVDNICSVLRLYQTNSDKNQFYELIKDNVTEV